MRRNGRMMWLLVLLAGMLLMTVPAAGSAAAPVGYGVWVGGSEFTDQIGMISGSTGHTLYDPDTQTLTLVNFHYNGAVHNKAGYYCIYSEHDLTIRLYGTSKLEHGPNTAPAYGIYVNGNLTIERDQSATTTPSLEVDISGRATAETPLVAVTQAIGASGNVVVQECDITANAESITNTGGGVEDTFEAYGLYAGGTLTVYNNATVTATSNTGPGTHPSYERQEDTRETLKIEIPDQEFAFTGNPIPYNLNDPRIRITCNEQPVSIDKRALEVRYFDEDHEYPGLGTRTPSDKSKYVKIYFSGDADYKPAQSGLAWLRVKPTDVFVTAADQVVDYETDLSTISLDGDDFSITHNAGLRQELAEDIRELLKPLVKPMLKSDVGTASVTKKNEVSFFFKFPDPANSGSYIYVTLEDIVAAGGLIGLPISLVSDSADETVFQFDNYYLHFQRGDLRVRYNIATVGEHVAVSQNKAEAGEVISITADKGYVLDQTQPVSVTQTGDATVVVPVNGAQFTMPAHPVTVKAAAKESGWPPQSGDASAPLLWLMLCAGSLAGMLLLRKKARVR